LSAVTKLSDRTRSAGDPTVIEKGRGSRSGADQLTRALGWFSLALGISELVAAPRYTRALGIEGNEAIVRAFGVREIGSGLVSLSTEHKTGLWSRVAGDALDVAALMGAMRVSSRRANVALALGLVLGVTLLDIAGAELQTARKANGNGRAPRDYRDRSGFPRGIESARGAATELGALARPRADTEPRQTV
jgi:hypothetical protein